MGKMNMKFQLLLFAFFFQLHSNLGQSSSPSTSDPSSLASTASSSSPTISGSSNNPTEPTTTTTTTESNNNNGGDGWFVVPGAGGAGESLDRDGPSHPGARAVLAVRVIRHAFVETFTLARNPIF